MLSSGCDPALLDSLDQALLTAPLFVLLEIFSFFGYRADLHQKMMVTVRKNLKEFKEGSTAAAKEGKAKKN